MYAGWYAMGCGRSAAAYARLNWCLPSAVVALLEAFVSVAPLPSLALRTDGLQGVRTFFSAVCVRAFG